LLNRGAADVSPHGQRGGDRHLPPTGWIAVGDRGGLRAPLPVENIAGRLSDRFHLLTGDDQIAVTHDPLVRSTEPD
jgi:hypothetical protein